MLNQLGKICSIDYQMALNYVSKLLGLLQNPSILPPGFESQAHHLHFYQLLFELCHVERTKINEKRPRLAYFFKKYLYSFVMLLCKLTFKKSIFGKWLWLSW